MCQIIATNNTIENIFDTLLKKEKYLKKLLLNKGGDYHSGTIIWKSYDEYKEYKTESFIYKTENIEELFKELKLFLINNIDKKIQLQDDAVLVLFSRQTPEMEGMDLKESTPPFYKDNNYYWVHGTINNDKEIEEMVNDKFIVDTESLKYEKEIGIEKYSGLFTVIKVDVLNSIIMEIEDHGMGYYETYYNDSIWYAMTPIDFNNDSIYRVNKYNNNIYVSYSGGMDITLSVYKHLVDLEKSYYKDINLKLIYFKYGSNAEDEEIKAGIRFKNFLINEFNGKFLKSVEFKIIDVTEIISAMGKLYGGNLSLLDKMAKGSEKETEENLSYIPYRNSLFVEILGNEMDKNKEVADIIFGLNLSEGMVFGDNHMVWLDGAEKVLKYGGKKFKTSKIISPYINDTKTTFIKKFIKEFGDDKLDKLLDISFSCYYPINGKPCGRCGSCILRKKAIERAKIQ